MGHCRFAQAIVKMGNAEVWGVAALSERPAQGNSTAGGRWCTTEPPDVSLRGGRRPTWRPEREARGSALGVQSREGSYDFADGSPVIQSGTARLPRAQSALAMTHQEVQWCASALLRLDGPVQAVRGVPGGACPSRTILHQRVVSTVISPETIFFDSSSTAFFTSSGTCCAAPSSP